ncbi:MULTISPECIES: hypothetical protein [unclassified Amycolatopsis]|uniref:hypothetical protein n=1 Tax=unclassified Amycolatopsis TaxID=2618356 RepID=UPI00196ABA07|nr:MULTISPECIES: hypothetical protein [unclassified Amycolatopsis]
MRTIVARTLISGSLLGAALAVAACGGGSPTGQAAAAPTALSAAPTASSVAAPTSSATPTPSAQAPAHQSKPKPRSTPAKEQPGDRLPGKGELGNGADCGPIDGPGGKVDVVTEAMPAGTVGCTEAINVMSDYLAQAPTKAEGTGRFLDVDGWNCGYDGGNGGSKQIFCGSKGLSFHGKAV